MELISPLGAARARRRLTVEEAAARARLEVEDVRCLEESRIYRFPSVENALAATLVYATALGISEREARELAGLPVPARARWPVRRWLSVAAFTAVLVVVTLATIRPGVLPSRSTGNAGGPVVASASLPPPWEIRVDVYNGTGIPNAATAVANEIGGPLAYRIGTVENAARHDYLRTRVYYPPGATAVAERLADQLGLEISALPGGKDKRRLVVVVGSDRASGAAR